MMMQEIEIFYPIDSRAWREWLMENHQTKQAVWIVFHKKVLKKNRLPGVRRLMLHFALDGLTVKRFL
ncbi:hypothetical protein [Sphingobacterium sp. JUb56]|uniref:hypothetical protein n=1 Tax=Sphingobacterium sp. JUb56 TaxID=2587145 RepID=UPI0017BFCA1D|nr:hypothetical protein [Sphingobacterium sp. JUb56]MBB2953276.1 hypothetical protein [Sphingobacterium sp. JUb56]